ncbi:hypothetical protein [Aureimonas sp. ME7]|uniref:DUF6894 family protein n=1 Tax=Aureimonas sp. ME7 TaxID=2744252 RepID=UPI0015FB22B9|nr:hypothetical protein [Aureimonas sp. ME7]
MRYYFNIREGSVLIEDHDGAELPTLEDAYEEAIQAAREMLATRVLAGQPLGHRSFEIQDQNGNRLVTVPFSNAMSVA